MIQKIFLTASFILLTNLIFAMPQDSIGNKIVNGKRYLIHKVSKGEGVYSIARKYNIDSKDVFAANEGSDKGLKLGQSLLIPRGNAPTVTPQDSKKSNNPTTNKTIKTHVVVKGNTLNSLARDYNTTVEEIKKLNNMTDGNIKLGQKIKIPSNSSNIDVDTKPATEVKVTPNKEVVQLKLDDSQTPNVVVDVDKIKELQVVPVEPLPTNNTYTTIEGDEITETGKALISSEGDLYQERSFVLHPTAKIGTIIMIVNPKTNQSVFARVVGNCKVSEGIILKINSTVAGKLGIDSESEVKVSYAK